MGGSTRELRGAKQDGAGQDKGRFLPGAPPLGFPAEFETTRSISGWLAEMFIYHLPADYFANYIPHIQAVTAADLARVAQQYIQPTRFAVVVVGDRKAIESGIRALNLGPVNILSVDEAIGPPS